MFRVGESPDSEEVDDVSGELTVFGDFDADDPDFMGLGETPPPSFQMPLGSSSMPARPRSRMSGSRNSSSSSLRRIASNNSLGRQLSENLRQLSFERLVDNGMPHLSKFADSDDLPHCLTSMLVNSSKSVSKPDSTQCHSCGALWHQEQFSLDCDECSGAAMTRNCLQCDGECGELWRREVVSSHVFGRASWLGRCAFNHAMVTSDQEDGEEQQHSGGCQDSGGQARLEQVVQRLQNM